MNNENWDVKYHGIYGTIEYIDRLCNTCVSTWYKWYNISGLELNRFLAGACRAPRLKNLGARPKIPVPGYILGLQLKPFLAGTCRAPRLKNLGARRKISVPRAPGHPLISSPDIYIYIYIRIEPHSHHVFFSQNLFDSNFCVGHLKKKKDAVINISMCVCRKERFVYIYIYIYIHIYIYIWLKDKNVIKKIYC